MSREHSAASKIVDHPEFRRTHVLPGPSVAFAFSVPTVSCSRCIQKIEGGLAELHEIEGARVDLGRKVLSVQLSNSKASLLPVLEKLDKLGFDAFPIPGDRAESHGLREKRRSLIEIGVAGAAAGNIMILAIAQYAGAEASEYDFFFGLLSLVLFLPVLGYSSRSFFRNVVEALRRRRASIDLAVVAALTVGTGFSLYHLGHGSGQTYFDSLSALVFLLLSSRRFLASLQEKHQKDLSHLGFLTSVATEVIDSDGGARWVPASALRPGDRIRVGMDQALPADGVVESDDAQVSLAVITGESRPVKLAKGAEVFAGSVALSSNLIFRLTAVGEKTRVGQILCRLKTAHLARTNLVTFTDRVGQWFTVSVLAVGSVFALFYWSVDPVEAISRALALTLLACPCALAFATPLAQALALNRLAKKGLIVKSAETLERILRVRNVVFDKTGTLTKGVLKLVCQQPEILGQKEIAIIRALEAPSRHPVARALIEALPHRGAYPVQIENRREVSGQGVFAEFEGHNYRISSSPYESMDMVPSESKCASTWVSLYRDEAEVVRFELSDEIRSEAKAVIQHLENRGLASYILSGDQSAATESVGRRLGMAPMNLWSRNSPEQKASRVQTLKPALMVGDGVNDALALAAAETSVAMNGGIEGSLRAADVFLASGDLNSLLDLFAVADDTRRVILRNLIISAAYNMSGASLALMGYIHPLMAAILMPLSSMSLIASVAWGNRK